jgi:hypothetical protein
MITTARHLSTCCTRRISRHKLHFYNAVQ